MVKDIGQRIAELRRERGLKQEELAELATLSRISIARYEAGKIEPGAKALGRIAEALEVPADFLLGRTDEDIRQELSEKLLKAVPQTAEARIISGGIDKMPPERREQALKIMQAAFMEYADYFDKKG